MSLRVSWFVLMALTSIFFLIHRTVDEGIAANITARAKVKNDLPRIRIISPPEDDSVSGTIMVRAKVNDPGGLTKVRFYVGQDERFKDSTKPYVYSWDTRVDRDGHHELKVQAEYEWVYTAKDQIEVSVKNRLSFWENVIQRLKNYWNKSKARLAKVMPVIAVPFSLLTLFLLYIFVQRRIDRKSEKLEWQDG